MSAGIKSSVHFPDLVQSIVEAEARIRNTVRETPAELSPFLSRLANCQVWLKLENWQRTGSFKLRGAANKLLAHSESNRQTTFVTASSGNHGAAAAFMLQRLGLKGIIYLPETAAPAKIDTIRNTGTSVILHGKDCVDAELYARNQAAERGYDYISPYNDEYIIAGQGTIGMELERQMEQIDSVLVPVGGGGLISGIAVYLKSNHPEVEIIGCQPAASAVMAKSINAGAIISEPPKPTLSDGTAGGIESGAMTFDICTELVDDFILVDEKGIAESLAKVLNHHHMLIEGSAALPVAALLQERQRFNNKVTALILSGANIGLERLKTILRMAEKHT